MTPSTSLKDLTSTTIDSELHHVWELESSHSTSQGQVNYMKCTAGCGTRRVECTSPTNSTSTIVSKEIGSRA